jgi:hypothetical protein
MILDARLATRLVRLFRWNDDDTRWPNEQRGPQVACRLIGDDNGKVPFCTRSSGRSLNWNCLPKLGVNKVRSFQSSLRPASSTLAGTAEGLGHCQTIGSQVMFDLHRT